MSVFVDYRSIPAEARGACVALGNFDGVHAGHRAVIAAAGERARTLSAPLAVLIFEPPPRRYFQPDSSPFRIMRPEDRRAALKELGVDIIYELPFNTDMSQMSPDAFVKNVLVDGLGLKHLSVGFDFRFGRGREGDTHTLQKLSDTFGFTLTVTEKITDGEAKISSTAIREALENGRPDYAAHLLGRYWQADGIVEEGEKRGRTINFPTANIRLGNLISPCFGVYAVWTRIEGVEGWYPGVANFGRTPTTGEREPLLEVNIFGFSQDIYGKRIDVAFVEFIRREKKFDSFEALTTQIATDASLAHELLHAPEEKAGVLDQLPVPEGI